MSEFEPQILTIEDIPVGVTDKWVSNNTLQIFEIETYKGVTVSTTIREIAEEAHRLKNKACILTVKVVKKINPNNPNRPYTNRYLQSIVEHTPAGMAMATAQAAHMERIPEETPSFMTTTPTAGNATVTVTSHGGLVSGSFDESLRSQADATQVSIHRQVAGKVAAQISSTPSEFWDNVQSIFNYFQNGSIPGVFAAARMDVENRTQTGTGGAQYLPADTVAAVRSELDSAPAPSDDDIPF